MEKQWVKFLKGFDTHQTGDTIEIDKATADSLKGIGAVEFIDSPEPDVLSKAFEGFQKQITDQLEKTTGELIEKVAKGVSEIKFPAVARDHDEEGMNGFKNLAEFMEVVKGAGNLDVKAAGVDARLKATPSGQNISNDSEGGYLVPDTFAKGLLEIVYDNESFLTKTDQWKTSGNNLKINAMIETSRKDGYRHNGALAYWLDEAAQFTPSKLKFTQLEMKLNKICALMYATEEVLDDSGVALAPLMQRKMGEAIRFAVNEAIFTGTGVGQPKGLWNHLYNGTDGAVIKVASDTPQDVGIRHRDIARMYHRMVVSSRKSAEWFVHANLFEQLEFITFNDVAGGQPIMRVGALENSITKAPAYTLYGRPVNVIEYAKDVGDVGDIMFADLSQYMTLTKAGRDQIKTATSIHVRFLFEEQAFRASMRIDGQPSWALPQTDYNGSGIRSPYVVLAARNSDATSSGI